MQFAQPRFDRPRRVVVYSLIDSRKVSFMKRMQLALSSRQVEKLEELKKEWGLSFAETVRRVIDASPAMEDEPERIYGARQLAPPQKGYK